MRSTITNSFLIATCFWAATSVDAQVVRFDAPTDVIQVPGNSVATFGLTLEARVKLLACGTPGGHRIYGEQQDALEDKVLGISTDRINGSAWTGATYSGMAFETSLDIGRWYHVAFVRDGGEERLYLDGQLQATREMIPPISNAPNSARSIGAYRYAVGVLAEAPACQIDYLRVSNSVRYDADFTPPAEADLVPDVNTELLYFFNEPAGSLQVQDESAAGNHGVVGAGNFPLATSPTLGDEALCPADLDGSCSVGFGDLTDMLSNWGPCAGDCEADLDGSGSVGFGDLTELLSGWGAC
jgi:hypothetical protein